MSRRVEIGLNQLINADSERQTQLFERIGLELQRSTDNFERQFSAIPLTRLVLTPHPLADQLAAFLGDYLSLPIEILDLAAAIDMSGIPSMASTERQAQCVATLGAALRNGLATGVGS